MLSILEVHGLRAPVLDGSWTEHHHSRMSDMESDEEGAEIPPLEMPVMIGGAKKHAC